MRGPRALAGITFAAAAALAAGAATAQVPYRIGDDQGSVTVDMGVLESLGPLPTVPEMLRPGMPVGELGYDPRVGSLAAIGPSRGGPSSTARGGMPTLGVDSAPAPDWLRRPDAPRYAPLPETLARPPAPRTGAPALTPPSTADRGSAPSLRRPESEPSTASAEPAAPPPARAEEPAAPTPPPASKPAATAAAAPSAPPPPAAKAPETPKAPPPPPLPAASKEQPAKEEPARPASETQVAAATTGPSTAAPSASAEGVGGDVVRVSFDPDQSALPTAAAAGLDAVVAKLRQDDSLRVQLLAYAEGDEDNVNKARRLSLSRALAVRAYLIDKQIQSTRMDVRALGNRTKEAPKDRVDVVLVSR